MYKFLCQGCLNVVISDDWEKYHLTDNSCPKCGADMCGCKSCLDIIEINNKKGKVSFICENSTVEYECNKINGECVDCSDFGWCERCINKDTEICVACRLNIQY